MKHLHQLTDNISVVRVVFEFYPHLGGSIALTETLSQKINCYLKNQLIIAPDFGEDHPEFDQKFKVPILRVKCKEKKSFLPLLPLIHLLYMVKVYFIIKKLDNTYKFDVIHTHGIDITFFGTILGKLLGIPVIGAVDGSMKAYSKLSGFYEIIMASLSKPEYLIVGNDGPVTTKTFKKIFKDKTVVVFIGIDTDIFKPMKKNTQLLKKLGLKESDFIILSTSSLNQVKRIDLAIESFISLISNSFNKNIYLLIAGHGSLRDELIKLAKKSPLDNIMFLGGLSGDSIPDYLSIADVVIGTSLYSNMNVSIQEAMSCGIPVVAFDSGGTNQTISHMNNGLLVKPGDIGDFANKLKLLYDNPGLRKKLGENARKKIIKERSWEVRIKKELEIYGKVLSKKNIK